MVQPNRSFVAQAGKCDNSTRILAVGDLALFEFGDEPGQNRPDFVPAGPASRPQAASSTVHRESAKPVPFGKK
jgi:hypothetical protein